ncbi:hypothetical protein B484DRAFT_421821 [Ochromonadaceae sp. CCMP2298]|nr:hypothetical protein B484DRAFT_421821 [Ochromonadaceae sp. CCMP2298]
MLRAGLHNLKSLQYLFNVKTLGSLPRRMPKKLPTKFIAQSADRLRQIVDLSGKVKTSSDFHDGAKGGAAGTPASLRLWGTVVVAAALGMLKSVLLGGSLFYGTAGARLSISFCSLLGGPASGSGSGLELGSDLSVLDRGFNSVPQQAIAGAADHRSIYCRSATVGLDCSHAGADAATAACCCWGWGWGWGWD